MITVIRKRIACIQQRIIFHNGGTKEKKKINLRIFKKGEGVVSKNGTLFEMMRLPRKTPL